jgi:hypothetical protein
MKKYYEQYKESRGQDYPMYHKQKEGWVDWSHLEKELLSKTRY